MQLWFEGSNTVICSILMSVNYHVLSRRGRITLINELLCPTISVINILRPSR